MPKSALPEATFPGKLLYKIDLQAKSALPLPVPGYRLHTQGLVMKMLGKNAVRCWASHAPETSLAAILKKWPHAQFCCCKFAIFFNFFYRMTDFVYEKWQLYVSNKRRGEKRGERGPFFFLNVESTANPRISRSAISALTNFREKTFANFLEVKKLLKLTWKLTEQGKKATNYDFYWLRNTYVC